MVGWIGRAEKCEYRLHGCSSSQRKMANDVVQCRNPSKFVCVRSNVVYCHGLHRDVLLNPMVRWHESATHPQRNSHNTTTTFTTQQTPTTQRKLNGNRTFRPLERTKRLSVDDSFSRRFVPWTLRSFVDTYSKYEILIRYSF